MTPRRLGVEAFARSLKKGERLFFQGGAGEPVALIAALEGVDPGLNITGAFVPGINPVPIAKLGPETVFSSAFMQPGLAEAQAAGRFRHIPVSYAGIVKLIRERLDFDTAVLQVAPPDANGRCSLGPTAEFALVADPKARRLVAIINHLVPSLPGTPGVRLERFDTVIEADAPLREYRVGAPSAEAEAIARQVARFIEDGAAVQIGLGKVPDALYPLLTDRRRLRLQSGMLSDGARLLAESGSLDPDFRHVACVHVGTAGYYAWLRDRHDFLTRGCEETHDVVRVATVDGFVGVNTALSVDLLGQANLEIAAGRQVSGVGGAPDFARAARLSRGGISIVALPATYDKGTASRIVARLDGQVSLPRTEIDVVVTEFGAADLRGASVLERAERLIAIAAPQHRGALEDALRASNSSKVREQQ